MSEVKNNVVQLASETKTEEQETRGRKKEPPVESYWTSHLMRKNDYAYTLDESGSVVIYKFNEKSRFWQAVKPTTISNDVARFLAREKPKYYGTNATMSCIKITDIHVSAFGRELVKTKDFVISTINHFLEVDTAGKIKVYSKDELGAECKKYFPRVHVNVALNVGNAHACEYKPQADEVIEGKKTKFAKIINLGFKKVENRRCAQEFLGDTINPKMRKALPILIGEPDGGKSQILRILSGLHTNSTSIDLDELGGFDTENILGCSLVTVDEIGKSFGEKHVKRLIGGNAFTIKRKGIRNLSVTPDFKMIAADNGVFNFGEKSGAIETRFFYLPVDTVPQKDREDGIGDAAIKEDLQDILDWCLNGAVRVVKRGGLMKHNDMPADSKALVESVSERTNYAINFLEDVEVKFSQTELIPKIEVYKMFQNYCIDHGKAMTAKVSFEVWCRDYFAKAIVKVCPDYDKTYERKSTAKIDGTSKRVMCFPITFKNEDRMAGKFISSFDAIASLHDIDSYAFGQYPAHILEKIKKIEETRALGELEKRELYVRNMLDAGYVIDADGGFSKGDAGLKI